MAKKREGGICRLRILLLGTLVLCLSAQPAPGQQLSIALFCPTAANEGASAEI